MEILMTEETAPINSLELATELTIAWLSNPNTSVSADEVSEVLAKMHAAVTSLSSPQASADESEAAEEFVPAVTVRKSLASKDHLISLIDGKPYRTLKRHLSGHGLTPQQYRERYNLKADYPMVSENYSQARREMAKKIGLGRKPGQKAPAAKRKPRGRKPAAK